MEVRLSPVTLTATHSFADFCSTRRDQGCDITALQLGAYGCISRFPTKADAEYAAESFKQAARNWALGPVQFKRVLTRGDAFFSVVYFVNTPEGKTFAKAFFLNSPAKSRLDKIYPRAFKYRYRNAMASIFCHELGQVLGLRHEFAGQMEAYARPIGLLGHS